MATRKMSDWDGSSGFSLPSPHFPQIGVQPGSRDNQVLLVGCGASSDGAMVGRRAKGDLPWRTFATLFYSRMIERKIHRIFTENFPIMANFSCRSSSCCFCLFATQPLASGHGIQLTGEHPLRPRRPGPYLSTAWWERGSWPCRKLPQSTWPWWTTRILISSLSLRKNTRQIGCEYFYKTHPEYFSSKSPKNSIYICMHLPRRSPTPINIYHKVGDFSSFAVAYKLLISCLA